jgi:hypothetical protein
MNHHGNAIGALQHVNGHCAADAVLIAQGVFEGAGQTDLGGQTGFAVGAESEEVHAALPPSSGVVVRLTGLRLASTSLQLVPVSARRISKMRWWSHDGSAWTVVVDMILPRLWW